MIPGLVGASVRALGQVFGARQLRPGCQAEFGEHLVQVVFDGAPWWTDSQADWRKPVGVSGLLTEPSRLPPRLGQTGYQRWNVQRDSVNT